MIEPGLAPGSLVSPPALLVQFLRQQIPVPCPSDIMTRRRAVLDVGGFVESFRRIYTDQVFYAKLCLKYPVLVTGQSWFKYRKHPNSAVSVVKQQGGLRTARLRYLDWLRGYLDSHHVNHSDLRRALSAARRRCLYPGWFRLAAHLKYRALVGKESLRTIVKQTLPDAAVRLLRAQRGGRPKPSR
jgi:hypothetical protein